MRPDFCLRATYCSSHEERNAFNAAVTCLSIRLPLTAGCAHVLHTVAPAFQTSAPLYTRGHCVCSGPKCLCPQRGRRGFARHEFWRAHARVCVCVCVCESVREACSTALLCLLPERPVCFFPVFSLFQADELSCWQRIIFLTCNVLCLLNLFSSVLGQLSS